MIWLYRIPLRRGQGDVGLDRKCAEYGNIPLTPFEGGFKSDILLKLITMSSVPVRLLQKAE
jgi:hypothetical protein